MNDAMKLFIVLAVRLDGFLESAAEAHKAFLDDLIEQNLLELTGPFVDGTGGAYVLRAADLETATQIAHSDPLYTTNSSMFSVHEWRVRRFP